MMVDKLRNILSGNKEISAWKINENIVEAEELFFIMKAIDMNRSKKVQHISLTIYKDFQEDGVKYRGSSGVEIHPTMSDEEIEKRISDAAFAASFVKNEYYPLALPSSEKAELKESSFGAKEIGEWMPLLAQAIFKADIYEDGWINSAEIFLNKIDERVINSEGVDASFTRYSGQIEFITTWKGSEEEVELYRDLQFSDFKPEEISREVEEMLLMSKHKALAKKTPDLKKGTVILTGESIIELFDYYYNQANAHSVYSNISTLKVNTSAQGRNIKGDLISLTLDPLLENSTAASPYDDDGLRLSSAEIYRDGVLLRYFGSTRYSHYIGEAPSGSIGNMVVKGGSKIIDELKQEPYLEILAFSDFQMDSVTGDFAGEIRFGWYYDGTSTNPVTGGSISSNIKDVQNNMWFSKEIEQRNNFIGPKAVKLYNVSIAG